SPSPVNRHSLVGAGFGFGMEKSMVNVEGASDSFGSYALGLGESFYPDSVEPIAKAPIAKSKAFEISFNFHRDVFADRSGLVTFYGTAGGGYLRNDFSMTGPCGYSLHGAACK